MESMFGKDCRKTLTSERRHTFSNLESHHSWKQRTCLSKKSSYFHQRRSVSSPISFSLFPCICQSNGMGRGVDDQTEESDLLNHLARKGKIARGETNKIQNRD
jgi:hypothetical protein